MTVVTIEHQVNDINMRMSKTSFSLKTIDQRTKIIHLQGKSEVAWLLWKTEFQINSYHTMSSNKNFTQNINRIMSVAPGQTFHGRISETQYASGIIT